LRCHLAPWDHVGNNVFCSSCWVQPFAALQFSPSSFVPWELVVRYSVNEKIGAVDRCVSAVVKVISLVNSIESLQAVTLLLRNYYCPFRGWLCEYHMALQHEHLALLYTVKDALKECTFPCQYIYHFLHLHRSVRNLNICTQDSGSCYEK